MDSSPRSGFRRAAAASWALTGLGIMGIAGASVVCYVDTLKPVSASTPPDGVRLATEEGAEDAGLNPAPNIGPVPEDDAVDPPETWLTTAPPAPPEYVPQTTVEQAPEYTQTPEYTQAPEYTPQTTVDQAPVIIEAAPPTVKKPTSTTHRRQSTTTRLAPSYSPPVVRSRGS
ncbi:hypothetical protein JDV09_04575 [Mycobacterium sp. Y57]|uniref:hypothetical protein n=1 Tax=Mycolicibacterium xanthum TaxID=2796469 RepID=UPI001C844F86|nr:hypothetical protein [Mycolicibacterium xanthum]MBX7431387.1 hypothetical protein [Mycolicibacterium xanthum]